MINILRIRFLYSENRAKIGIHYICSLEKGKSYDIIIAGGGLGGLCCGAVLSKEGYNVCLLEKNDIIGGCLQSFGRNGKILDTGVHYIGSLDEGQIVNQYFKYMGILDKLRMKRMDESGFDKVIYGGESFDFAIGHDQFTELLGRKFPKERGNLNRYTELLKEIGGFISVDVLKKGVFTLGGTRYFSESASGMIAQLVNDERLRNVLAATSLLYGGVKECSSFYHHAVINNSYIESAYRMTDGSQQIADSLAGVIIESGGTVLNNAEVTRFIAEEDRVLGVEINGEEVLTAGSYISNIHPQRTLELTDKTKAIKRVYVNRINVLPNTFGVFSLYLIMRKGSQPYINNNVYIHASGDVWYKDNAGAEIESCMISYQSSGDNDGCEVITLLVPMDISCLEQWYGTSPDRRGEDYLAFKEAYSRKILDFVKSYGYDFYGKIERMYSTTPLSFKDYTATKDGSAYGIMKDCRYPEACFVPVRSKLKNMFFTGQNVNLHGVLGVTLTAMLTCSEFIGQEYLARKVGSV